MKKILFDQSTFDIYNRKYIDSVNILHFLRLYYDNVYLIKKKDEILKDNTEQYVKGIINYSKNTLRKNPIGVFQDILTEVKIYNLSDLLVISSDQEFLYLFINFPFNTCLIYKNKLDCMEINPTYEFNNLESVKKLILK